MTTSRRFATFNRNLGLPFIAAAAIPLMRASSSVKKQFGKIEKTAGVLLIASGVAFLTGSFQSASLWLIETFPQFGQVGRGSVSAGFGTFHAYDATGGNPIEFESDAR